MSETFEVLLNEIKSFLNFTWEDSSREGRIRMYILSSIQYLNEIADYDIDFEQDYLARDLLFNRVLYMDSQALDDFGRNYNGMLEELRIKYLPNVEEHSL